MSLTNVELKEWFKDEFSELKIRLSVNEDKSNEILRRIDVIDHSTHDHRDTLYGKGGLLEQFTALKAEHCIHMHESNPELKVARKSLRVDKVALVVATCAVALAVFKDVLVKLVF